MLPNAIGLYVNCGTPGIRDIVVTTVYVCTGVVPGTEYSLDSAHQLLLRDQYGKSAPIFSLYSALNCSSQLFQIISSQVDIVLNALFFLHLVDELLKVFLCRLP